MSANTPTSLRDTIDGDPYSYFETLRANGPIHWDEAMRGWVVVGDEQCRYILQNEQLFRHPYADADADMIAVKGGDALSGVCTVSLPDCKSGHRHRWCGD